MDESKINPGQAPVERVGGYRVVRRLATGGTSDVLLAKAEGPHGFERTVVLKLLLSQYRNDEQFAKMFAREAAAYARLSHPAIVQLYDFFQLDGQLVMVLEYVDGAPLSRLRGMFKAVGQSIDDKASLFIAQRIFSALAAAHEASGEGGMPTPVIHRDVNPSNVLVPWDGHVKIADFGIARVTGVTSESVAGMIKGTYGYMAPEQVEGGAITPRADVYAAGIILWELLTKRRAFQRGALPEIEVLRAMAEPRITSIDVLRPDVDRGVREALGRALQPRADKRNITAEEMAAILREIVPPEEGRERLASLLALVRHEPRPAATSAPPPAEIEATERMPAAKPVVPPLKPPKPPPRPASVPRMTAAYGAPPPVPPPRRPPAPPAVTTKTAVGMPVSSPEPTTESAPQLVEPIDRDSAKMRLGTPLAAIAPGLTLKDAIDEILSGVPSSIPPSVLPHETPAPPQTSRMMGQLPPAPAPLNVTMPLGEVPPARPPAPSEMPELAKTIQELERAEQPTISPPRPAVDEPPTMKPASDRSPRPPEAPFPALDRTLALDSRVATAPMPAYRPPPAPPAPALASSSQPVSSPPSPNTGTYDAIPARPKSSSAGLIALLAATAVAAGVAGTFGYIYYQRAKSVAPVLPSSLPAATPPPTVTATPFVPTASASAAPIASESASGAASASPPTSAAPSASVAVAASASASAVASATPPAPSEIPAGMGVLKTAGAAPNRRIFVDERTLGQTPESVTVKCGTHTVRLGSSGRNQTIDVPCGGEITVGDR